MRIKFIGAFVPLIVLFSAGALAKEVKPTKQQKALLALTPDSVASQIAVKDDALETVVTVSSEPVWTEKQGLLGIVWNDNFLRAFVDKKTGKATIQVYEYIAYRGDWRHYNGVNYETPTGPETGNLDRISAEVVSCEGSDILGGCKLVEHLAFAFPAQFFGDVKYDPSNPSGWRYRLKSKSGRDWDSAFVAAEIIGFMRILEQVKSKYVPKLTPE
jgi:hypothetical protein